MDKLTQKGRNFIDDNIELLSNFALQQLELIQQGDYEEDNWIAFDMLELKKADSNTQVEDSIDINIWWSIEDMAWKATAHPMEINSVGEVQTNTQDFIELF